MEEAYPGNELGELRADIENLRESLREVTLADAVVVSAAAVLVLEGGYGWLGRQKQLQVTVVSS